jgi:lipoprotein-releasing system permease protein
VPLYIKIALRYLLSLKSKALSFMSIISLIGITVGVSALLITLAVLSGFQYGLKEKILQTTPHVVILKIGNRFWQEEYEQVIEKLKNIPQIVDSEPFIYSQALASVGKNVQSIFIRGVIPDKDKKIMAIDNKVVKGNFDSLKKSKTAVIGKDLALILDVDVGDKINLISPFGQKSPLGYIPKIMQVEVVAIVDFGMYEYNSGYVSLNLKDAQKFLNMENQITGIQLKLKDPYKAEEVKNKIEQILKFPYFVRTWIDMNKSLFQALKLEQLAMFLVIALIVLVASFNISSLLITKSREKRKDIAILKTVGAKNNFILKVFLWQGLIIGIAGTVLGLIIGLSVIYIADTYHLIKLNPQVYMMEYLPLKISFFEIAAVVISSMVICFISSIIPAYFASREVPAEVLRYE